MADADPGCIISFQELESFGKEHASRESTQLMVPVQSWTSGHEAGLDKVDAKLLGFTQSSTLFKLAVPNLGYGYLFKFIFISQEVNNTRDPSDDNISLSATRQS